MVESGVVCRSWSLSGVVALAAALVSCADPAPNVVVLVLDTLRADRLGAYAGDLPEGVSTEIDALAERGVRFANAVSTSSWTRPAIGSLLTSRHPRTLGLYTERLGVLPDAFATLPEILDAAGYRTIGLTANPNINRIFNFHQGFDVYIDSHVVFRWMDRQEGEQHKRGRTGLRPAADVYAQALQLAGDGSEPTYLQIDVMDVHEWSNASTVRAEFRPLYSERPDGAYLRSVRQVSVDTGRFLDALLAREGWRDALVVLVSDHGEGLSSHPDVAKSRRHGRLLYPSQTHIPLVLHTRSGRLPSGAVVDTLVSILDVAPTVLDYVGLPPLPDARGTSLLPLVLRRDGEATRREPAFVVETLFRETDKLGIVTPQWTYIENRGPPHPGVGPRELQPWGTPANGHLTDQSRAHPEASTRLAARLGAWEAAHPRARPVGALEGDAISPRETEQLRALGYLDAKDEGREEGVR